MRILFVYLYFVVYVAVSVCIGFDSSCIYNGKYSVRVSLVMCRLYTMPVLMSL